MSTSSNNSATAFSRLNRPGSGRLLNQSWGGSSNNQQQQQSSSNSASSTPASLSPTTNASSMNTLLAGASSVPRMNPVLPSPGGGLIPDSNNVEQREKRIKGLKISFSQPNIRQQQQQHQQQQQQGGIYQPFYAFANNSAGGKAMVSSEEKSKLLLYKGNPVIIANPHKPNNRL